MGPLPWLFGLSIDEDLRWAAAQFDTRTQKYGTLERGIICDLPRTDRAIDLQKLIFLALEKIKTKHSAIFENTTAVGISSIGFIDVEDGRLMSIDRKNWKRQKDGSIINFHELKNLFSHKNLPMNVQNDATAKCFAEYQEQFEDDSPREPVRTLCYANFRDGINGSIVRGHEKVSAPVASHHELGHIFPPLHQADYKFNPAHSNCPIHTGCFIAVASDGRRKLQWPEKSIYELKDHRDDYYDGSPWDIFTHYVAHFCWNIVMTFPPDRILLGGELIVPQILKNIRIRFNRLNRQGKGSYIDTPFIRHPKFIDMAILPPEVAGTIGALELARLKISPPRPLGVPS